MELDSKSLAEILKGVPWFEGLSDPHFEKLVALGRMQHVEVDERLFQEGDAMDDFYILLAGRVGLDLHVPTRGRVRFYTVEPVDVFGWSSVTPVVRQRTAGAVAVLASDLAAFNAAELRQLCEKDHELGYYIMRRMANVIAARLQVTRLQLLDMFSHPLGEEG